MLVVDLETIVPSGKPDFRVDEVERVGWLEEGAETAKWSRCWCPLRSYDEQTYLMHNAMYDLGIMARNYNMSPINWFLKEVQVDDTLALAYCQGGEDLSLKGLAQKYLG